MDVNTATYRQYAYVRNRRQSVRKATIDVDALRQENAGR